MPSMTEDETVKLDKLKGERSQLRRVFTNAARRFSDVLESTDIQTKDISSDFNKVIEKAERLFKVDEEIKAVTFEYTDEEFDIIESYRDKLTEIKSKYSKHLQEDFKHPEDDVRSTSSKVEDPWLIAKVIKVGPQPRTYTVKADNGGTYVRNRFFLRPYNGPAQVVAEDVSSTVEDYYEDVLPVPPPAQVVPPAPLQVVPPAPPPAPSTSTTRSGRTVTVPTRYRTS
ncbi:hypothetical protein JTE90_007060 [Oedothorax gibbosus]|uniref:Uncharacterized protein n=1 Tax=Oedothorax gibbosus TaxID=931172 RepID=A0AAV6U1E4_9ARAC|nr:hypothetical protein JTE90_007060 [Oedothorax gibbosus]